VLRGGFLELWEASSFINGWIGKVVRLYLFDYSPCCASLDYSCFPCFWCPCQGGSSVGLVVVSRVVPLFILECAVKPIVAVKTN